jgi:hypothetical protein
MLLKLLAMPGIHHLFIVSPGPNSTDMRASGALVEKISKQFGRLEIMQDDIR